jgi:hypothetical protein
VDVIGTTVHVDAEADTPLLLKRVEKVGSQEAVPTDTKGERVSEWRGRAGQSYSTSLWQAEG